MKNILVIIFTSLVLSSCEKMLLGPDPANTPIDNYDVLWQTIDEKYGLFPVTNVNWDSLYFVYRDQITEQTSEYELWEICCNLISHLQNGHLCLINQQYTRFFSPDSPNGELRDGFNLNIVRNNYLNVSSTAGNGIITYGVLKETNIGYIHFQHFMGTEGRDWIRDLDDVIRTLEPCDGIILDVRNNGGGLIRNDIYAASYFTDKEITYYYSQHKTGPAQDDFGDKMPKILYPRTDSLSFLKKTAVLTNRFTASGAEAFTLMLRKTGRSIHIGDTTIGALGEVTHVAQLPNGWTLKYPATLTTLDDGTSPECVGIAPEIYIKNFVYDVVMGYDVMLETATEYLLGEE